MNETNHPEEGISVIAKLDNFLCGVSYDVIVFENGKYSYPFGRYRPLTSGTKVLQWKYFKDVFDKEETLKT
jgi:hypothetical protein